MDFRLPGFQTYVKFEFYTLWLRIMVNCPSSIKEKKLIKTQLKQFLLKETKICFSARHKQLQALCCAV